MLAESGEAADPRHAVAFAGHRDDAPGALQKDALVRGAVAQAREEHDVAPGVDRRDDGQRLLAESIERAAARGRVAGAGDRAQDVRRVGVREIPRAGRELREQEQGDHRPARAHTAGV